MKKYILIFICFPFYLNSGIPLDYHSYQAERLELKQQPGPSYFQIYNTIDEVATSILKSNPNVSFYLSTNLDGERWLIYKDVTVGGLYNDVISTSGKISEILLEMMFGFINHRRDYPLSMKQFVDVLKSYGIKGFECETRDYKFKIEFESLFDF